MSGDREAFEKYIDEDPMDHNRRMVFADWLEEHGEGEEASRQRQWVSSRLWIEDYADSLAENYDIIMHVAKAYTNPKREWWSDGILCRGAKFDGDMVPDEFWDHYEIVTGEKVKEDNRGSFLGCSC